MSLSFADRDLRFMLCFNKIRSVIQAPILKLFLYSPWCTQLQGCSLNQHTSVKISEFVSYQCHTPKFALHIFILSGLWSLIHLHTFIPIIQFLGSFICTCIYIRHYWFKGFLLSIWYKVLNHAKYFINLYGLMFLVVCTCRIGSWVLSLGKGYWDAFDFWGILT